MGFKTRRQIVKAIFACRLVFIFRPVQNFEKFTSRAMKIHPKSSIHNFMNIFWILPILVSRWAVGLIKKLGAKKIRKSAKLTKLWKGRFELPSRRSLRDRPRADHEARFFDGPGYFGPIKNLLKYCFWPVRDVSYTHNLLSDSHSAFVTVI